MSGRVPASSAARQAYDALGANGVPEILVGDRRMNGYGAAGFERIFR